MTIIDPFVGSGTLLFEASSYNLPNLERPYAWLNLKIAPKLFKSASWKKNYRWFNRQSSPQCLGFDLDEKAIISLEKNKIEYRRIFSSMFNSADLNITAKVQDSRDLKLERATLRKSVWIVANPPYGIRLADENAKQVLENLAGSLQGSVDGIIVIHPVVWRFNFKKLSLAKIEDFSNQGLNLKLSVFVNKPQVPPPN